MPIIIAQLLRTVIMALVSALPLTLAQELFDGTVKKLIENIRDDEGLTLQEAKDIVFNFLADLALNATIIGAIIKMKIAVKTTEYFGLTNKGLVKKTLTTNAKKVVAKLTAEGGKKTARSAIPTILKIIAVPGSLVWMAKAIADIIEPGAYQPKQINAIYKKLGIPFQYPITEGTLKPGPFDADSFKDYAKALEAAGIRGLNNPTAQQTQLYSREGLADVIDWVYGNEVFNGNAPTAKKLIPMLAQYLLPQRIKISTIATGAPGKTAFAALPQVRIFTGVLSSGTLGAPVEFQARENDLIESVDELQVSAENNLVPFLAGFTGRLSYEIKIASSWTGKDGTRRDGGVQQIQTGTNQDGTPKLKTVHNKFAVLNIFVSNSRGVKTKVESIGLGPTDAIRLQPTETQISFMVNSLKNNLASRDLNDVTGIATANPITVTTPVSAAPELSARGQQLLRMIESNPHGFFADVDRNIEGYPLTRLARDLRAAIGDLKQKEQTLRAENIDPETIPEYTSRRDTIWNFPNPTNAAELRPGETDLVEGNKEQIFSELGFARPQGIQTSAEIPPSNNPNRLNATTIAEFFDVEGRVYPSVEIRARLYEAFNLGLANLYIGSAEQNTRLLAELKRRVS